MILWTRLDADDGLNLGYMEKIRVIDERERTTEMLRDKYLVYVEIERKNKGSRERDPYWFTQTCKYRMRTIEEKDKFIALMNVLTDNSKTSYSDVDA